MAVSFLSTAVDVRAGGSHTCALQGSGAIVCWGAGNLGQLGNGSTSDASIWAFSNFDDAIGVSAGYQHSCGVNQWGQVACWGNAAQGQLGNGSPYSKIPNETCSHSECVVGDTLDPECSPCITAVCSADPFCCGLDATAPNQAWDSACIDSAITLCPGKCEGTIGSCVAACGAQAPGNCWCDSLCNILYDCCADKSDICG